MKTRHILALIIIVFAIRVQAQDQIDCIKVIGKASLKAIPENMTVRIPLVVKDSIFEICSDRLISKMNQVNQGLQDIGIKEDIIKTDNFSLEENYEYIERERVKVGYIGAISIKLVEKYSPETISKIISLLKQHQLTYNIDFTLSESQKLELIDSAIKEAVADAKSKATLIAKETGVKLIKISKIIYDYSGFGSDQLLLFDEADCYDMPPRKGSLLTFNPSEINIEKKIQIEWEIEN